jgi:hypothetical protein
MRDGGVGGGCGCGWVGWIGLYTTYTFQSGDKACLTAQKGETKDQDSSNKRSQPQPQQPPSQDTIKPQTHPWTFCVRVVSVVSCDCSRACFSISATLKTTTNCGIFLGGVVVGVGVLWCELFLFLSCFWIAATLFFVVVGFHDFVVWWCWCELFVVLRI